MVPLCINQVGHFGWQEGWWFDKMLMKVMEMCLYDSCQVLCWALNIYYFISINPLNNLRNYVLLSFSAFSYDTKVLKKSHNRKEGREEGRKEKGTQLENKGARFSISLFERVYILNYCMGMVSYQICLVHLLKFRKSVQSRIDDEFKHLKLFTNLSICH